MKELVQVADVAGDGALRLGHLLAHPPLQVIAGLADQSEVPGQPRGQLGRLGQVPAEVGQLRNREDLLRLRLLQAVPPGQVDSAAGVPGAQRRVSLAEQTTSCN